MRINKIFRQILVLIIALTAISSCQSGGSDTPTEAYKRLYDAVKKNDIPAVKQNMSKTTVEFVEGFAAPMQKKSPDEFYKNGLLESNLSQNLPVIRDERMKDNFGAVQVQRPNGTWEDVPFVKEDGRWKLAVGDVFKNTYQRPGAPVEDANTAAPQLTPAPSAANATGNAGNVASTQSDPNSPVKKTEKPNSNSAEKK